jgi:hypothetical protein
MLDEIPPLPPILHHLFTLFTTSVDDPLAKHFRKKIRLDSGMAMASFQANDKTVTRGAPGCFKVVGQLYRRISSLLANEQSNAKCLQVYFLDPDYEATLRATRYLSDLWHQMSKMWKSFQDCVHPWLMKQTIHTLLLS